MNRILLISLLIAIAVAVFFKLQSDSRQKQLINAENKISVQETQIKGYENAISEYNTAQQRASGKIEKVRTIVKTVKSDCDCWNTLVDERVRNEAKKRKNSK
jgi:septal ring-binding cell division protein DamX